MAERRMPGMSTRTVLFLVIFFVLAFVSEQAPSKIPVWDGSGDLLPDAPVDDKKFRKVPPFGNPALADDDFNEYRIDNWVNNPSTELLDIKDSANRDYDNDLNKPEPEIFPRFDKDEPTFESPDVKDEEDEMDRNKVDEESGTDETGNEDNNEPQDGEIDDSFEDKDTKIRIDEDDESRDDEHGFVGVTKDEEDEDKDEEKDDNDVDDEHDVLKDDGDEDEDKHDKDIDDEHDVPKDDDDEDPDNDKVPEDNPGVGGFPSGIFFDNPFFNLRPMKKYFHQLEKAFGHLFRATLDEAFILNGTYANTTEEEVEIDGKKFVVQKSIIKGRDNSSSFYVETLSTVPKTNETEDEKDSELKK